MASATGRKRHDDTRAVIPDVGKPPPLVDKDERIVASGDSIRHHAQDGVKPGADSLPVASALARRLARRPLPAVRRSAPHGRACGQPCRCAPGARAGCRPPWYARWATTAARDVPAPARARAPLQQARQAGLLGVGGLAPPARGQLRHAGAFGQQQPHGADHGRIGQAYIELIDDAFSQIARGRGAVDHRLHVQRRRAQVTRDQRLEHRFLAGEMRIQPALDRPARSAMSSILAPAYPEAENSCSARQYLRDPQSRRKPAPLSPHGPTPEQNGSIKTDWPVANLTLIRNDQDRLGTMTARSCHRPPRPPLCR